MLELTSNIEAGFQRGEKTSAAFVDLSAAYDTVWLDGLMFKLKQTLRCKKLSYLLENMLKCRYFRVTLGEQTSKSYSIKNGLPQGSVLAPLLFNLYIRDMPPTTSQKFCYADDMALIVQTKSMGEGEDLLAADLEVLNQYYKRWRLCPNPSKTEVSSFHLNNRLANTELKVIFCEEQLRYNPFPKYLGITLDRSLTFKKHLELTGQKLKTRNNLLHKLAGTTWGATANTLRTAAQSLVYSVAEYCAPVWARSAHTSKVDVHLNTAMRIVSGTIRSTPIPWLHVLSNIAPPNLRRLQATDREVRKAADPTSLPDTPIQRILGQPTPNTRLKSRKPIWNYQPDTSFDMDREWRKQWSSFNQRQEYTLTDPTKAPPGMELPRKIWSSINRVRTGHARCKATLHKFGMIDDPGCDCGTSEQTVAHIVLECPNRKFNGTWQNIMDATPSAVQWIGSLDIDL